MRVDSRVIVAPVNRLVPLDYLRRHLRLDTPYDDDIIKNHLVVATRMAEQFMNRSILTQTLQLIVSHAQQQTNFYTNMALPSSYVPFSYNQPNAIILPYGPVSAINSVAVGYWGGTDTTLTLNTDYLFNSGTGEISLPSFGYLGGAGNHAIIQYITGMADLPAQVSPDIIHAVLLIVSSLYINRGDEDKEILTKGAKALLTPYAYVSAGSLYG